MVLVSVSRTHTVSIRRFINLLDFDAYLIDKERIKKQPKSKNKMSLPIVDRGSGQMELTLICIKLWPSLKSLDEFGRGDGQTVL